MKSKALPVHEVPAMTENRAQSCQLSGLLRFATERISRTAGRHCLVLVLLFGLPAALSAQKQQGQWTDLRGLKVGQGVEVIESNMKRHGGEFVSVSDEVFTLQEKGSDVSIKREAVVRVSTTSGARRGEHAVIGLVVGGAIGAAVGAAAGSSHGFFGGSSRGIAALVGVAIGAPSGAAVGAVVPAHATVYRAESAAAAHETRAVGSSR